MKKLFFSLFVCTFIVVNLTGVVKAQSDADQISADNFSGDALSKLILAGINSMRWKAGDDSLLVNDVLTKGSKSQAEFYADRKRAEVEPGMAGDIVKHNGGTKKVDEIALETSVSKSKTTFSYQQVANDILDKINKSKKFSVIAVNPKFFYTGVTCALDKDGKKVYISVIEGGLDALNNGTKGRKKMKDKYSLAKRGLYPYDSKDCKACEKFAPELDILQQHMYLQNNQVFLESDDLKKFKKFFHMEKDGLAVDVVQREQYPCDGPNIMDNNLNSKGILLKPIYQQKIYAKNIYAKDKKATQYKAAIAKIPNRKLKKLGTNFELNLVYIANKTWCKTITRKYLETGDQKAFVPLGIWPDTGYGADLKKYVPKPENQVIEFNVPYEQGKATYNPNDVSAFLKDLNEPKYQINGVTIDSHSSVEGDSLVNDKLQKGRAESIVSAMQTISGKNIDKKITTSDSWDMFIDSVRGTAFDEYAKDSKYEIKQALRDLVVLKKLEPILAKERFSKISMNVTYDITGDNEQPFVISQYKKAIAQKNSALALSIQKYIIRQVLNKRYDPNQLIAVTVPGQLPLFASLIVNDIYVDDKFNQFDTISPLIQKKFDDLDKTMSSNDYVHFNKVLCDVKLSDLGDDKGINDVQAKINGLYSTKAPQGICDNLNLEYQFKIMEKLDTLPQGTPNPPVDQALERVKKIYNVTGSGWQGALKLAYVFNKHNDLNFSMKLLAPFANDTSVSEQLLFTYISVAAHFPDQIFSRNFRMAMSNAATKDKSRYCDLFGNPYLTFQLLDNPLVKQTYCNTCDAGTPTEDTTPKTKLGKLKNQIKVNIQK